jgi:hypothetical protein
MLIFLLLGGGPGPVYAQQNPAPPGATQKLIFIHHSTGENWLADWSGGLGAALRDNNYFVSDTNYGWGPDSIGDLTDIGHWYNWFVGPQSPTYLAALYAESWQNCEYSRLENDPGGENGIVMFKSCFPNSFLGGGPADPTTVGENPLRGMECYDDTIHTVANAKGVYNDLLAYFATRPDKMFVLIISPPQAPGSTDEAHAANARALADWLRTDWLAGYEGNNVFAYDFYNVLTSNSGDEWTADIGTAEGNHHRFHEGAVQHLQTVALNTSAYAQDPYDGHPTEAGNQKATYEFLPVLNVFYNCWQGLGECPQAITE